MPSWCCPLPTHRYDGSYKEGAFCILLLTASYYFLLPTHKVRHIIKALKCSAPPEDALAFLLESLWPDDEGCVSIDKFGSWVRGDVRPDKPAPPAAARPMALPRSAPHHNIRTTSQLQLVMPAAGRASSTPVPGEKVLWSPASKRVAHAYDARWMSHDDVDAEQRRSIRVTSNPGCGLMIVHAMDAHTSSRSEREICLACAECVSDLCLCLSVPLHTVSLSTRTCFPYPLSTISR